VSNELTKSARRVFDILELFRERQCPLRLKDVVDSLGMPTSSAAARIEKNLTEILAALRAENARLAHLAGATNQSAMHAAVR
jgi:hypothetical protein